MVPGNPHDGKKRCFAGKKLEIKELGVPSQAIG